MHPTPGEKLMTRPGDPFTGRHRQIRRSTRRKENNQLHSKLVLGLMSRILAENVKD